MPDPRPLDELIAEAVKHGQDRELGKPSKDVPTRPEQQVSPSMVSEIMRFRNPWAYITSQQESLPGYIPEAIQSDYALKQMRQMELQEAMRWRSFAYNDALPPAWDWLDQHLPGNLAADGRPFNQYGEELPYGAVEWTPQGNPSFRKEGEGMLKGIWDKYWATLTAPYGEQGGEGSLYGPAQGRGDIDRLLRAGVITQEEARKREAERAQVQGIVKYRIQDELSRVTGEKPDLGTVVGRYPKAVLNAWIEAIQLPAYEAKRVFSVTEDIIATAYKDLGIPLPSESQEDILAKDPWMAERAQKLRAEKNKYWEAYFEEAPTDIGTYFRESYVDFSLDQLFTDKDLIKGGPLDASRQAGRMFYTGLLDPLAKADYIERYRLGQDPYMLARELENPIAEAIGEVIFDPLYVVGFAVKHIRDGIRLGNITRKFLGQTPFVDTAIEAIQAAEKTTAIRLTDDVYEIAAGALKVDNVNAFTRFTNFKDKTGIWIRTNVAKQHFVNRVAGEVFKGITSATLDPQKQADAFLAIIKISSSNVDEIKQGLVLASNFEMPRLLYSDAARQTGFMLRQMMKNEDGIIDTARFIKELSGAQQAGVVALAKFGGKKIDDAIDSLYPSVTKRLADTADAKKALEAGKDLTQLQNVALADTIPTYVKVAAKFDASWFGRKKRVINNIFASIYMGYNPGWLMRNAQNNILTTVVDQGIEGLRYWHSGGAMDNIASWVGKMDVEGFGGRTKLGIVDIQDFKRADLPEEVQELMSRSEAIQSQLDEIAGWEFLPSGLDKKQGAKLTKQLKAADYDLRNKMKSLGLTTADVGEAKALFGSAEKMEAWSGKNVVSAAVERSMLKMLKPGKAIPDVSQLITAGMPEPLANHLINTVVRKKGDIYGAVAEIANDIKKGESIFVMAGRSHLPDDIVRQMNDMRWMQQYDDIVIGGFIRGEPRDVVIKKFRAATIEGWEELATKVSDDVVTLSGDIDGAERIRNATQLAAKDGAIDEQQIARVFTYRGLNHASSQDIRIALDKLKTSADTTGDTATLESIDSLSKMFDQGGTELTAKHNKMLNDVLESINRKPSTPQEIVEEWNRMGLEGVPPSNLTLAEFTNIRWRELYFEPTRKELAAARDVMYKDFQELLENNPGMVIDQHFLDEVNKSYLRSVAYDPVLRADEVRLPLSAARKAEDWDTFARILAHQYGIESVTYEAGRAIPNDVKVLNIINENLGSDYVRLGDIPEAQLNEAFLRHATTEFAQKNGLDVPDFAPLARPVSEVAEAAPKAARPFVPPIGDNTPLMQRMAAETRDGAADLVNRIEMSIHDNWGKTMPNMDGDTKALLKELKTWADEGYTRIAEAKLLSRQVGYTARDFALHSYPQKYGFDIALSYIYPYEFWHTRTYAKWIQRALTDPAVVATYGRYIGTLEKIHADAPEWWKYNVNTDELLGIDTGNPIYFSLLSSLNPLYGMTGVDFNDPQKRVTWYANMVDNIGKWGPGTWTILNWAVAAGLAIEGESEAAKRWAGRLTPQSRFIKAALSLAGINIKTDDIFKAIGVDQEYFRGMNEFDPIVLLASRGIDPYEYQRVVKELGGMVDDNTINTAQMIDAFMKAQGEHWDMAHERAIRRRAPGDITSFMLGVGFKGRNKTDMDIEIFYRDLYRVMGQKDTMAPEEYRDQMRELFKDREWGQGLLIGRKRGYARDEALAYNVLSRIEPGKLDNILKDVQGLVPYSVIQEFYRTKGENLYTMAETDRVAFMNTINIMNAVMDLPDNATQELWQAAKSANSRMRGVMELLHGRDIHELISGYYSVAAEGDIKQWTQGEIWDAQQSFLDAHPQVETAMDTMAEMRLQNPEMAAYYSSIEGLERYGNSLLWDTLTKELGEGIFDEWNDYWNKMLVWDGEITRFEQDNPWVLDIKERRNAMAQEAENQLSIFELANPIVLMIDEAYTAMWEKRVWAVYNKAGVTLNKLWDGYWAIPEYDRVARRAYYNEHAAALELGEELKREGIAHIEETYSSEQLELYEQWKTITDERWDLYNFGYKDVLINEGVTKQQFADFEEYNNLFTLKSEEREAIFAASEGLSRYTELKSELSKQVAEEIVNVQQYLPQGIPTKLREDVGRFGDIQQDLYDYLAGQAGVQQTYYNYSWTDWVEQIDDPVMNLIEDSVVDGYKVPDALMDNLEYEAERLGIPTPEILLKIIEDSYRRVDNR